MGYWKKGIDLLGDYVGLKSHITCKCHCGTIFDILAHNIIYGTNSCGCMMHQYDKSYKWKGCGGISASKWVGIKTNSKNRKIYFDISIEYAWNLFIEQNNRCIYTDLVLMFDSDGICGNASLDRIDSTKGYIEGNVQWAHKDVNMMKWDMPEDNVLYYSNLIVEKYHENKKHQEMS